ncbi:hypothetical protein DL95DRAFT_461823 [Leptodontidium sp. 2 PMI_412]|nr:hypothetical protein DL95DRAFT_461823 [Leptodontidium sp. 2 PMI_412]
MRKLVASLPELLLRGSHEPIRYPWVEWARLTLTISAANKIIMIHRSFLIRSFRSPLYAYTKMTCISAATTILREHSRVKEMDVAAIWIVPAFTIAARIIMMLDLLHKPKSDSDIPNCRQVVQTAIEGLPMDTNNRMDARGAMILVALLKEEAEGRDQHTSGHGDFSK